ncbi:ferredoxin [Streptomyces sp. GXMU-J15]|uniref:Ferredoxin n=1 Tax=Streptomyces fuscus TaxID=3048495 RepID=A0ABT7JCY2_9ACTN|nr:MULTISPECIES: ferredoxin [Streptomyces]MDL2081662.1 ferredoxin [Streptomyces fuscus]SBT94698.1 Ferredoxin [Streptomyces sp. DI166]
MKITVDRERCVGAGQCVLAASDVFDQSREDGLVELLEPEPSEDRRAAVNEAELICPSGAIEIQP